MSDISCVSCSVRNLFASQDVWVHKSLKEEIEYIEIIDVTKKDITFDHITPLKNVFDEIDITKLDIDYKPKKILWFSRGSWLYDPYHDNADCKKHNTNIHNENGFFIKSPNNILRITNIEQLDKFIDNYSVKKVNYYNYNNIYIKIDWNKVREVSKCYGVAFEFCKVEELVGFKKSLDPKYYWYSGFDVESLCIWDLRAFDNIVYPATIHAC